MKDNISLKDVMYEFLQEPSRGRFSEIILNNTGEQNAVEFKKEWIGEQKLAQIILGIANTSGGALIFGVEELSDGGHNPCGLSTFQDKAKMQKKLSKYLPEKLPFTIHDFDYSGEDYSKLKNKKFQVIIINHEEKNLPYMCPKDGDGLKAGSIYIRRGTSTEQANESEVEELLNKRIKIMYSTKSKLELEEHLQQLKVLFSHIKRTHTYNPLFANISTALVNAFSLGASESKPNPNFPEEDYEQFILRMIEEKKKKIERVLDIG